jgi:hypothetical protein
MANHTKHLFIVLLIVCLGTAGRWTFTPSSASAGPATLLDISIDDGGARGSDGEFIPYDVTVTAQGGSTDDTTITIVVPLGAQFALPEGPSVNQSNADLSFTLGWICTGDGSAGDVCTLSVGPLADDQPLDVQFSLIPTSTLDIYVEVEATALSEPTASIDKPEAAALGSSAASADIVTPYLSEGLCYEDFLSCAVACAICYFLQADSACFWLGAYQTVGNSIRLGEYPGILGSSPGFTIFRLRDQVLTTTRGGQRITDLYYEHSAAIVTSTFSDSSVMTKAVTAVTAWTDAMDALVDGEGDTVTITQGQIDTVNTFLDTLRAVATGDLAAAIDRERANLDIDGLVGATMDDAFAEIDSLSCEGFETTLFCGEVTGDCSITATDALSVLRIAVGLDPEVPEADTDGNGMITATDALKTLRIAVGSEPATSDCNP